MRRQSFLVVNTAIKCEIAVCPFSCYRAETEVIFVSPKTKPNILCAATFRRCLKCNLSPCMNFGHHTSRQSTHYTFFLITFLKSSIYIGQLFYSEHGNSNDRKLRFYVSCVFLGRGRNDSWCSWHYGLDRYAYYKFYFKLLFSYGSVC